MVNIESQGKTLRVTVEGAVDLATIVRTYSEALLDHNERDFMLTSLQLGIERNTLYRRVRKWRAEKQR